MKIISQKRLKERLIDICAGAGISLEGDLGEEYFVYEEHPIVCIQRLINGISVTFNIDLLLLTFVSDLHHYEDIYGLRDLVHGILSEQESY